MSSQMANSQDTFSRLLEHLDYIASTNLITRETSDENIPAERETTWREARDKLGIDAIYFVADAPVIYFKRFEVPDQARIAALHRNVWSQSKIPLLFVILPGDIRIYSGYEPPKLSKSRNEFIEPSRLERKLDTTKQRPGDDLWQRLSIFTRLAIESGSFWREYSDSQYFKRTTRADQKLVANLRYIRRQLITDLSTQLAKYHGLDRERDQQQIKEISSRCANNLIGRSIFALYLQDRGVLTSDSENFFSQNFGSRYQRYVDLLTSHEQTYAFFTFLHDRFNGDIFPVDEEEKKVVRPENLEMLQRLFTEEVVGDKGHRQKFFFWAYNFEFIPIELISSIYEEFLHEEEDGKDGTYYTPPRLVDFVLDQVLPEADTNYALTILDPACGSGIFLVEAYRRLVERWRRIHKHKPSFIDLINILTSSIFGVDIKREALAVASFSLCLALSDYLEPKTIWMQVKFPSLIKGGNLIEADFFDKRTNFAGRTFDLVVGNPPWESQLTEHTRVYLSERGLDVGDKQIAQAFLWHAPEFCSVQGKVALLCSSKNLLFNRSGPNIQFRQKFFRRFTVTQVFDFSALRHFLFEKAIHPTAAIFYTLQAPTSSTTIFYGAPKPTYLTHQLAALVIEQDDLKYLPFWQVLESIDGLKIEGAEDAEDVEKDKVVVQHPLLAEDEDRPKKRTVNIWKVALWGTSYDYILLQHLNQYPTLGQAIQQKKGAWISKVGFNYSGPGELAYAPWLDGKVYIAPQDFTRYGIDMSKLQFLPQGARYYRRGIPEQFKAPLVLFKRTQVRRQIGAAYLDQDCAYSDTFTCIAGPEEDRNLLKAITALLNSELAQYYLFLTTASWGVEREEIKAGEMRGLPFPFFDVSKEQIDRIAHLVDELATHSAMSHEDAEQYLNDYIYRCFLLNIEEIQHIRETIAYTIDFFHRPEKSSAFDKPTVEMKKSYATAYMRSINFYLEVVDRKLISTVYVKEATPLLAVKFSLNMLDADVTDIQEQEPDDEMHEVLTRLSRLSTERLSGQTYHRRNFRIYANGSEDILYRIKPAERRQWTIGAAYSDAEETVTDLM